MIENIDKALFYAIKRGEFPLAKDLFAQGANIHAIFQEEKGQYISSLNMFVRNFSKLAYSKGPNVSMYRDSLDLFNAIICRANLQCKCAKEHKCPLFYALEAFRIESQQDILNSKSEIVRQMIINGATIRFEQQQNKKADKKLAKWSLRWLDIAGLRSYLITKKFCFVEVQN